MEEEDLLRFFNVSTRKKNEKGEKRTMQNKPKMPPTPAEMEEQLRDQEIPEIFEIYDDKQIIESIKGKVIEESIYDFLDSRKHRVLGLTFTGVKLAIQQMGGIEIEGMPEVEETEQYIRVRVKARHVKKRLDSIGVFQQKKFFAKGGKVEFAYVLCHNKALRNAWRNLIPEAVIKHQLDRYKESEEFKRKTAAHKREGMSKDIER